MSGQQILKPENIRIFFDSKEEPAAYADAGETVVFYCMDCYGKRIIKDGMDYSKLLMPEGNPVTGPLYIRGAEPGDVLEIEVQDITVDSFGSMCVRDGIGAYEITGSHCRQFPIEDDSVIFDQNIQIRLRPMIGVIGTCPSGAPVSTEEPGEHGGNLDIQDLGIGSRIYLPVSVPGGLLSVGDLHGVQGDGETAICGLEVNGSVTLKVNLLKKPRFLPTPFLVTEHTCCTTAAAVSLDECSLAAARKMHRWLTEEFELTDAQAAMLLSLQGNLRISQIVNPLKGCVMELPLRLLHQLKRKSY